MANDQYDIRIQEILHKTGDQIVEAEYIYNTSVKLAADSRKIRKYSPTEVCLVDNRMYNITIKYHHTTINLDSKTTQKHEISTANSLKSTVFPINIRTNYCVSTKTDCVLYILTSSIH
jgi:hypothetical protein